MLKEREEREKKREEKYEKEGLTHSPHYHGLVNFIECSVANPDPYP
jgi:hypothetical protein